MGSRATSREARVKRTISRLATAWLERGRRKRYAGNAFDRFEGLAPVLSQSAGATVLDIGCCDGLVAYEFARHGAAVVHGFELDEGDVLFARRLFRDVPVKSTFVAANLAIDSGSFTRLYSDVLLDRYDIVLFLGVYHHLEQQMSQDSLEAFVRLLADMTERAFVIRTNRLAAVDPLLREAGLVCTSEAQADRVGSLRVYEREAATSNASDP